MKQEDKELLLKDLCARLPYGVKCDVGEDKPYTPTRIEIDHKNGDHIIDCIGEQEAYLNVVKPYLFPLSSMTKDQKNECFKGRPVEIDKYGDIAAKEDFYGNSQYTDLETYLELIDWLNKNHFDYRGLIEKGLAIDATGLNIY